MEKIITYDSLRSFAYVNDKICAKPIKGIVLSFFGLSTTLMYDDETMEGEYYAQKGILFINPYNNPWSWMNKQAVAYTDEIIDVLIEKYNLDENIPIASTGASMGGQSALVYTAYAKRTPIACVVNCPVCDVAYHFTERPDLPRTFYSALFNEEGTLDEALKNISPLHLVDKMPKVKYHVFHCGADKAVNIDMHSEKLVKAMRDKGFDVTYDVVPNRGHGQLTLDAHRKYSKYIVDSIENN